MKRTLCLVMSLVLAVLTTGTSSAFVSTKIDGEDIAIDAIVLMDDHGGAYTYYKLRDLGEALGFAVDWSAEKGIYIKTK